MYDTCLCTYVIIFFMLTSFYKPLGLMWGFTPIYICKNTKCIVIMSIKPSFYIKKFMTPGKISTLLQYILEKKN